MQKKGTLERLDPETGKAILARREYYVEATCFLRRTELLLCAFADGWASFIECDSGADLVSFSLLPDAAGALLTCVVMDHQVCPHQRTFPLFVPEKVSRRLNGIDLGQSGPCRVLWRTCART